MIRTLHSRNQHMHCHFRVAGVTSACCVLAPSMLWRGWRWLDVCFIKPASSVANVVQSWGECHFCWCNYRSEWYSILDRFHIKVPKTCICKWETEPEGKSSRLQAYPISHLGDLRIIQYHTIILVIGSLTKMCESWLTSWIRWREVPQDWKGRTTISVYKGKGDAVECSKYRGVRLLEHGIKVYEDVLKKTQKAGWNVTISLSFTKACPLLGQYLIWNNYKKSLMERKGLSHFLYI